MLPFDSLVIDLIFKKDASPNLEDLVEALGGEEVVQARKLLDPDTLDPRLEMSLAPSVPLRRRGERRLMVIDDSVAPLRADLEKSTQSTADIREEKNRLVAACALGDVRIGRIFGLGVWGDAVIVAADAKDLRAVALMTWALDPMVDLRGNRRASQLSQAEFEEKLLGYEKRLEELDEAAILKRLGPARFERHNELLVVDVLETDGTWDLKKSLEMEQALAAMDAFSMIPGAPAAASDVAEADSARQPAGKRAGRASLRDARRQAADTSDLTEDTAKLGHQSEPSKALAPVRAEEVAGRLVLVFPMGRFDLDVAAAIGKKDWESILLAADSLEGRERDRVHAEGAGFVAPLEFLSEVFFEGKPLSKSVFESRSSDVGSGVRALEVHCPRFGPVMLYDLPNRGRFISSECGATEAILKIL